MAKVDLHCHTKFSELPNHWFMKHINAYESYTEPEELYRKQKAVGMDFVTVTDHNRIGGCLELQERYPDEVFLGVEATTFFPEDGCAFHLLIYDFTPAQFERIQKLRQDIYALRDFLVEADLPHALAHPFYAVNGRTTREHIEKCLLLFNAFEVRNGGRGRRTNDSFLKLLQSLTPETMAALEAKHGIPPASLTPWVKGMTGGSDDHSALLLGTTFTEGSGSTPREFLNSLQCCGTTAVGRHNTFQALTFNIIKIALDHSKGNGKGLAHTGISRFAPMLFETGDVMERLAPLLELQGAFVGNGQHHGASGGYGLGGSNGSGQNGNGRRPAGLQGLIHGEDGQAFLTGLFQEFAEAGDDMDARQETAYKVLATWLDTLVVDLIGDVNDTFEGYDIPGLAEKLSNLVPGVLGVLPFVACFWNFHKDTHLIDATLEGFGLQGHPHEKRVLWFTDTLTDLNGVSSTLRSVGFACHEEGREVMIAAPEAPTPDGMELPPNVLSLKTVHEFPLPHYEHVILRIPSLLGTLKQVHHYHPDEIIISSPGPVGLIALAIGKLMKIPVKGVYHTDFYRQVHQLTKNASLANAVEDTVMRFFRATDQTLVPTEEYIDILAGRGLSREHMEVFPRGIEADNFQPLAEGRAYLRERLNLPEGPILLYTGRISKDKNLDFLLDVHQNLREEFPDLTLLLVGDGPGYGVLHGQTIGLEGIAMPGALPREELPLVYSGADLLVFPSLTDTFGMSVLEAQACGLPAVVSDFGGPQALIRHGETGMVAAANDLEAWMDAIASLLRLRTSDPAEFARLRADAREHVISRYTWTRALADIFA